MKIRDNHHLRNYVGSKLYSSPAYNRSKNYSSNSSPTKSQPQLNVTTHKYKLKLSQPPAPKAQPLALRISSPSRLPSLKPTPLVPKQALLPTAPLIQQIPKKVPVPPPHPSFLSYILAPKSQVKDHLLRLYEEEHGYLSRVGNPTKKYGAYGKETYVSSYFRVDEASIMDYLGRKKFVSKKLDKHLLLKECPFCPDNKNKIENMWKLYVMRDSGAYFCHRCGSKGSWFDLKSNLGDIPQVTNSEGHASAEVHSIPNQQLVSTYPANLQSHPEVLKYLTGTGPSDRHLSIDAIKFYEVGLCVVQFPTDDEQWADNVCVTFPWVNFDTKGNRQISRIKMRSIVQKKNMRLEPKGGQFGFFGWHTVPKNANEIVLTEGEFDAIAVYQATGQAAISLPNGAHSLPVNLIPLLERFERIYLWLDDDVPGQEGAKKFAQKLGFHRCFIVRTKDGDPTGPKDANDALKMGKDLKYLLLKAKRPSHEQVITFSEVRLEVELEILHPEQAAGVQSLWFPKMNTILKGHRKGEVTVFTGATGIGKTTILSQLSLDYCLQGVRTLWGSFELQLPRLVKKMMYQYSNRNLAQCIDEFDVIADKFSSLPMYFLRFFGSSQVDQVLDAMEYAVYVHDIEHIIIDNIQFMTSGIGRGVERFEVIDDAIHKFRQFATHHNVHLTLVIHPRKQDDEAPLSMADVFGNAKATQEADNVIILQKLKQVKYMDIRKNRFSGDLGHIYLQFDKAVQRFSQQTY